MGIFNWKKKGKSLLTQTEENLDIYENIDTYLKKHNIVEPDASVSDDYRYEDREMQGGEGLDNEFSGGSKPDFEQYTWEQCQDFVAVSCEQMQDASRRIEESKREMQIVNSYMSDVQLIQNMPTENRNDVEKLAKRIVRLEQDKEEYGKFKSGISDRMYELLSHMEGNMSATLKELDEEEKLCMKIKKDLNLLEGEKKILKIEKQDTMQRMDTSTTVLRGLVISVALLIVFYFMLGMLEWQQYGLVVLAITAIVAVGIFIAFTVNRNCQVQLKLNDMKMNKAIVTMNHIKIKYVNSMNHLNYQYDKYQVRNVYELSQNWNQYVVTKRKKEHYRRANQELYEAREDLVYLLNQMNLYDSQVWASQASAILNQDEQTELLSDLEVRRCSLKEAIDFEMEMLDRIKGDVMQLTKVRSEYAQKILALVDEMGQ